MFAWWNNYLKWMFGVGKTRFCWPVTLLASSRHDGWIGSTCHYNFRGHDFESMGFESSQTGDRSFNGGCLFFSFVDLCINHCWMKLAITAGQKNQEINCHSISFRRKLLISAPSNRRGRVAHPPNPLVLKWPNVLLMDFTSKATQVPKLSIWCSFRCWFWSHFCWTLANDLLKHVQAGSFAYSGALFVSMTIIKWSVEMVPLLPAMLQLWLVRQRKETLENCGGCKKHQGSCLKVHPFSSLWKTTSGRLKVIS